MYLNIVGLRWTYVMEVGKWWYLFLNIIDQILKFQHNNLPEGEPLKADIVLAQMKSE